MRLEAFRRRAAEMWDVIPEPFRVGVEALVVEADAVPHPEIAGVYTLGECVTDHWPSGYSEEGDVRSRVYLYHGSFRAVAGLDPAFDWGEELWETLLHELLHHREFAAAEGGLEAYDWAMDENFKRYAGRDFDPAFYRVVPADERGEVRIESEMFVETRKDPEAGEATFRWRERGWSVRVPGGDVVWYVNPVNLAQGRLWVVVWPRRPWWAAWWPWSAPRDVRQLRRRALPELTT